MKQTLENVRLVLKDPFYQEEFKRMLYEEIKNLPRHSQLEIIDEFRKVLND